MQKIELYGLARCSTCVKARHWLDQRGHAYDFIDYRDHPIPPDRLRMWAEQLGGWEKVVNRASMTWRNLPEDRKNPTSADEWLGLIAEFPALVRRPVMAMPDGAVSVGFSEKKYDERFA